MPFPLARDLPASARRNVLYDAANGLGNGLFTALVINFVPVIARRNGADALLLAALAAAPFAANVVGLLGVAWLPTTGRARYLALVQALGRGVFLFALLGDWPIVLLVMLFGYYLSYALTMPLLLDALRDMYPDRWRGRLMGYVRIIQNCSAALAAPLAGWLMDVAGQRALLVLGALFGVLGAAAFRKVTFSGDSSAVRTSPWAALGSFVRDPLYRGIALAWVVWGFGGFMALPLYPLVMVDRLGVSYAQVGLISLALAVGGLASYWVVGMYVDRGGGRWALLIGFALAAPTPLVYQLAPSVEWLALAGLLNGLGFGAMELGWASLLLRLAPGAERARIPAVLNFFTGIRGIIAPFVGVALASWPLLGVSGTLWISALVGFAGVALLAHAARGIPIRIQRLRATTVPVTS